MVRAACWCCSVVFKLLSKFDGWTWSASSGGHILCVTLGILLPPEARAACGHIAAARAFQAAPPQSSNCLELCRLCAAKDSLSPGSAVGPSSLWLRLPTSSLWLRLNTSPPLDCHSPEAHCDCATPPLPWQVHRACRPHAAHQRRHGLLRPPLWRHQLPGEASPSSPGIISNPRLNELIFRSSAAATLEASTAPVRRWLP